MPPTSKTTSRSTVFAPLGSPSPTSASRPLQILDAADAEHADVDDLDLGVEAVPVLALVRGVECVLQLLGPRVVDRPGRDVEANLVALARVAAVGEAAHEAPVVRHAVAVELRDRLGRQLVEARGQPLAVERLQRVPLGRDVLVLEIGREQPGRRGDPGMRRDEHARDLELERDVAGEERPGAAGRDERELARVVAAPHAVQLDRLRHPELLDLQRAERGVLDRDVELLGDLRHRAARELGVELHVAAEQAAVRPEPAEQELRVGRRRLLAAAAVAGRARVGARRLRADAEDAAGVDVGDRAAAGADRVDVDHRHHRLVVADLRVEQVAHAQLPVGGDADVGGGAADVERDDVLVAGHLARPRCRRSGRRPGPDMSRLTGRCVAESTVAMPPADCISCTSCSKPASRSASSKRADVAGDLRPDVRVQADGREALELAVERQHLVRDGEVRVRELLEHDLLDPPLVLGVEVRVEQADRDGLDAGRRAARRTCSRTSSSSSGDQHVAVRRGHALAGRSAGGGA